jgi:hypothetical protein
MREVHGVFGSVLGEIQKQRHLLGQIEGATSEAAAEMEGGNEHLEEAAEHQIPILPDFLRLSIESSTF